MADPPHTPPPMAAFAFALPAEQATRVSYEDLHELLTLAAAMLATGTPKRLLARRLQGIRSYEYEPDG